MVQQGCQVAIFEGMNVFVSFDGDGIGAKVGRALLADDADEIRRISQAIDHGNEIWRSWALSTGGNVVSIGADEGRLEIPADRLDELPDIRRQYSEAVGATVSVGVGMTLSESAKALLSSKVHGKDRITFFTSEINQEISDLQAKEQKRTELDKVGEEYLKAEPALNQGTGAGMAGETLPAKPQKPVTEGSNHSQGEAAVSAMEEMPKQPEGTHAAQDFEDNFHQIAGEQSQKDQAQAQAAQQDAAHEDIRGEIVKVLKKVKAAAPVLEQIKSQAPEVYAAVEGAIKAMVNMARELKPQPEEQIAKTELQKTVITKPQPPPTHHHLDLPVGTTKEGKIKIVHGDGTQGWVSVRAGQVLSQDGHAISSRNPGGR